MAAGVLHGVLLAWIDRGPLVPAADAVFRPSSEKIRAISDIFGN